MLDTLRALAEPNRFQIVELLREGPQPVGDLVHRLKLRQPQVSKHLRVLSEAGLVEVRVDAQRRIYELRRGVD
jgi:DNA-binding transcriptional ArsR family regulator